jgi:SAM-dependent methyltransferase
MNVSTLVFLLFITLIIFYVIYNICPYCIVSDTAECFGPVIYILSLGCGLTMTMTDKGATCSVPGDQTGTEARTEARTETGTETDASTNTATDTSSDNTDTAAGGAKKHIWLPARSMLVLRGAARYQWAHGIAPRTMDKVDGELIRRKRRVSFTIREAVYTPTAEDIEFAAMQREVAALGVEKGRGQKSATSGGGSLKLSAEEEAAIMSSLQQEQSQGQSGRVSLMASKVEEEHVFRVYDEIAQHWHHTRGKRKVYWQVVRNFLEGLPVGCLVADVGCGDGKYFGVGENIVSIGCDRSPNLLQVSRDPNNATFCCDAVSVPFVSNKFDAAICIAVLHHLASVERRLAVISEIVRVLRPGGRALIQAWALEQETTSKRRFNAQDVLVPWSLQQQFVRGAGAGKTCKQSDSKDKTGESEVSKSVVFQRFCHVYKEGELETLINQIPSCTVVESGYDKSNWFIMIEKIDTTTV